MPKRRRQSEDPRKLSSLFEPRHVVCGLTNTDRNTCIQALVALLDAAGGLKEPVESVCRAILEREELVSTHVKPGLAIPHARTDAVDAVRVAVGASPDGVDFGSEDMGRAHVVVLIITPKLATGDYLQALAAVAHCFSQAAAVEHVAAMTKPRDVWDFFDSGGAIPEYVRARDMMSKDFLSLRPNDRLKKAIDLFCRHPNIDLPVIDDDGDLVGRVTQADLLRIALPEYILWLDDLSPIIHFEPFAEVLKDEETTYVAEMMNEEFPTVPEDAPAIQIARELIHNHARQIMVVRGKKLAGVITLSEFLTLVLRG